VTAELSLIVRRVVRAPVERVFAAWTEPEHLRRWWGPKDVRCVDAEVELVVGGKYRIGNLLPDGTTVWIAGEFLAIAPPRELVYTWRVEPAADTSRVTVRFVPRDGGTEVIVVHDGIASAETRDDHERGWNGCLDGLAAMFAGAGAHADP
jgi:uncharacterized protein YndB with AHSA1/START domain